MKIDTVSLTIEKARELLAKREVSAQELAKAHFARIYERETETHAFLEVYEKEALEVARRIDEEFQKTKNENQNFELLGIPGALKDNILIKGHRVTAGSKILENYQAPYDATVARKLREAGTIFLGKTNMDEFAMGSSTENSAFGATRNPHDPERVPGGSSGGSAAAVAGGMALWALGSDTGGSIRQPAGFCGAVGLKPTYGSVSRYGLIAMASSLDQIGPITKTVRDAGIVFEAIAGEDKMDSTSSSRANYTGLVSQIANSQLAINKLRVGVPKEYFSDGIDPAIEGAVMSAIKKLDAFGAKVEEVSLPHTSYALACYYIIQPAEVSANLARYDGIRYGVPANKGGKLENRGLEALYSATRGEGFGKEVRRRILLGTYVLSAGYYDAYYAKAQKVRRLIRDDFLKVFEKFDIIIGPTSPTLPFKFGERALNPVAMYLSDIYTVSANLAGVPALSIPCGTAEVENEKLDKSKLPIGLQIIGKHFDEKTILQVGDLLEQNLEARK